MLVIKHQKAGEREGVYFLTFSRAFASTSNVNDNRTPKAQWMIPSRRAHQHNASQHFFIFFFEIFISAKNQWKRFSELNQTNNRVRITYTLCTCYIIIMTIAMNSKRSAHNTHFHIFQDETLLCSALHWIATILLRFESVMMLLCFQL